MVKSIIIVERVIVFMANDVIREEIERSRFKKYQIAEQMGISATSFSCMLRRELTDDQLFCVRNAISKLKEVHS